MLSFAEEIYLLALDENTGKIIPDMRDPVLGTIIIAAILVELAFSGKITTDKEYLHILNSRKTNSPILDDVLEILKESHKESAKIRIVLKALMSHAKRLEKLVLSELLKKGILKEVDNKILWIFPDRCYPLIDHKEIVNVELRIRKLILSNDKADPKDAILVSLLDAAKLFAKILFEGEEFYYKERIRELSSNIGEQAKELIYQLRDLPDSPYHNLLTEEDTIV